ncbi:MAG TPA: hypothetical protein VGV40_06275 [Solirubrobacteraceae bacterium]|nr:hypothetical protein [Solirubrobacteraceae bacterium]
MVLGAGVMLVTRELTSPAAPVPAAPAPPARAADDVVQFEDAARGISIAYPADWQRLPSSDPEVRLLAEGGGSSMLVRTADLGITVGPQDLDPAKKITDGLVRAVAGMELLRPPRQVSLAGLPGYLYLYTFPDAATLQQGAHAHYFLFRGQTMISVVFQTVPSQRFAERAPGFDRIAETLRVTEGTG